MFVLLLCRFELLGVNALNFLMTKALGGGGVASIRIDPQVIILAASFIVHLVCIEELLYGDNNMFAYSEYSGTSK